MPGYLTAWQQADACQNQTIQVTAGVKLWQPELCRPRMSRALSCTPIFPGEYWLSGHHSIMFQHGSVKPVLRPDSTLANISAPMQRSPNRHPIADGAISISERGTSELSMPPW